MAGCLLLVETIQFSASNNSMIQSIRNKSSTFCFELFSMKRFFYRIEATLMAQIILYLIINLEQLDAWILVNFQDVAQKLEIVKCL